MRSFARRSLRAQARERSAASAHACVAPPEASPALLARRRARRAWHTTRGCSGDLSARQAATPAARCSAGTATLRGSAAQAPPNAWCDLERGVGGRSCALRCALRSFHAILRCGGATPRPRRPLPPPGAGRSCAAQRQEGSEPDGATRTGCAVACRPASRALRHQASPTSYARARRPPPVRPRAPCCSGCAAAWTAGASRSSDSSACAARVGAAG